MTGITEGRATVVLRKTLRRKGVELRGGGAGGGWWQTHDVQKRGGARGRVQGCDDHDEARMKSAEEEVRAMGG